jgi:hypothetical protein
VTLLLRVWFLALAIGAPVSALAHKVSAVSVVAEFDTREQTFKVELAMDVDPTGDPAVDDQIPPEQAARNFATESIEIFFDDQHLKPEPGIRLVTTTDENTPKELMRKAVIGTLAGTIPKGAENFLLRVTENTEAAVVMVTNKDGKPARRLQVLYPGEFSNPLSLASPVLEGDPFEKEGKPAAAVPTPVSNEAGDVSFAGWLVRGFRAVLPYGIDFWAFMLALFLLSLRSRPLGWQVGAYTVAHSLGLALTAFKLIDVPESIVLPIVAASALYPTIENLFVTDLKPWRPPLIATFGFAHGLAFAGILAGHGPETLALPTALIGFNLGIELAQFALLVVASVVAVALVKQRWFRHAVRTPLCVAIAAFSLYRLIDELTGQ